MNDRYTISSNQLVLVMAEAVAVISFVSAVSSLADYGWRVVRRLNEFRNTVNDLPQCFHHISVQLPLLVEIFEHFRRQAQDEDLSPKIEEVLSPVVEGLREEITKLDAVLLKVLPSANASTWEKSIKAIKSVAVEKTVEDFASVIRDYVSSLTTYQMTQNSDELKLLAGMLKDQTLAPSTRQRLPRKPVWMMTYDSEEHFVGRDQIMNEIKRQFDMERSRVAITGIGGVGKSRIAIQYSYRHREHKPFGSLFWIHGGSRARFEAAYQKIARKLGLQDQEDREIDTLSLVCDHLSDETNGSWLIVLDNADDRDVWLGSADAEFAAGKSTKALINFLPRGQHGQILITTRDSQLGHNLLEGRHDPIHVARLGSLDSRTLLQSKLSKDIGHEDADELVKSLEYLPLAISQAAAYLKQIETTASEYLELFRAGLNDVPDLLEESIHDPSRDRESNCVFQTWKISFDHISKQHRSAARVLSLMATLDRQAISKELLFEAEVNSLSLRSAIAKLKAFSLIDEEKKAPKYSMHRLVQLSTQRWLEQRGELSTWQEAAVSAIRHQIPDVINYEHWPIIQELNSHIQITLAYKVSTGLCLTQRAGILHGLGHYYLKQCQELLSLQHLREAAEIREQQLGLEHEDTLTTMSLLSVAYSRLGRLGEAQQLQQQVLEISKRTLGEKHRLTLKTLSRMAIRLSKQGYVGKCQVLEMEVLDSMRQEFGSDDPDTLTEMSNLAYTLNKVRYWEAARELHQELLDSRSRILGETHPDTLTAMLGLARTYKELGCYQDAEALEMRAVDMRIHTHGLDHPRTVQSMFALAKTYRLQARWRDAQELESKIKEVQHRTKDSKLNAPRQVIDQSDPQEKRLNQFLRIPYPRGRPRGRSLGDREGETQHTTDSIVNRPRSADSRDRTGQRTPRSRDKGRLSRPREGWTPYDYRARKTRQAQLNRSPRRW